MITFKEVSWSNLFSYGENNHIDLQNSPLTQIVGKNGFGKSSIPLIIEEVLFNQNSKKIKKGDILNRYIKDKSYQIELVFDKDGDKYEIKTTRTNTTSQVKLLKNGVDISNHTATGTYKNIEQILGYDHKTFSQIVYQSSVGSLEFLTATDTARKKFLIELLNLGVYTKASEVFKELASAMSKQVDSCQAKISTVQSWLKKYERVDLVEQELLLEPESPQDQQSELTLKKSELTNIESTNKKIATNNKYKELIANIKIPLPPQAPPLEAYVTNLKVQLATYQKNLKEGNSLSAKCDGPTGVCATCTQTIDNSTMYAMVKQFEQVKPIIHEHIDTFVAAIEDAEAKTKRWEAYTEKMLEIEKYHALIDINMSSVLLNKELLAKEIKDLETIIAAVNQEIVDIRAKNKLVSDHNAKVKVIAEQMGDMQSDLATLTTELSEKVAKLSNLQVLVKAFSTTGLVAYKIECLVKDLETLTNEYLAELADGRFQLSFKIASADKLNVVITDNGRDIDIIALSSGERARVNVATLLAIRKLMQTLSNSRTNLLVLDETVENLDAEGKEKLIEVLLKEENLNTFLISHGFTHPLLEKIQVVKEQNISRIEQ